MLIPGGIQAKSAISDLSQYENCWPVHDLLKSRLKATSTRIRREWRVAQANRAQKEVDSLKHLVKQAKKDSKGKAKQVSAFSTKSDPLFNDSL